MKTDDLIYILSEDVKPVDPRRAGRAFILAILAGFLVTCGLALSILGPRDELSDPSTLIYLTGKIAFALASAALAGAYLFKCSHPGDERQTPTAMIVAPFVAILILAGISLANAPTQHWSRMLLGNQWLECLVSIPVIAIAPFALVIWAVHQAAPTDLRLAGALAGLLAGEMSATGYALHCADDSLPYLALWYGGTIAICALAGAILGPKLLRW